MKKKKILILVSLILVLVSVCAFAFADATNGAAGNVSSSGKKISLKRGQTLELIIWGNYNYPYGKSDDVDAVYSSNIYVKKNGKDYYGSTYGLYLGKTSVKVTSGSSWLKVIGNAFGWNFTTKKNNTTKKARTGVITVRDSRGLVATYKITQLPLANMEKMKCTDTTITLVAKKISGITGFAFYTMSSSAYDMYPSNEGMELVGSSKTRELLINVPSTSHDWYYKVRPYMKLKGGRIVYGPFSVSKSLYRSRIPY